MVLGLRNFREDSDLDIALQYKGDIREDDVFNELMDEPLYLYDIKVDFIPYREEKGNYITLEDDTYIVLYEKVNKVEFCKEKMMRRMINIYGNQSKVFLTNRGINQFH